MIPTAALGDAGTMADAARRMFARAEQAIADDPSNFVANAYGAYALAALGDGKRAREWMDRALSGDSENQGMRYNLACAACAYLHDLDLAVEVIGPLLAKGSDGYLQIAKSDPDLDLLRGDPRFEAMMADAEERLAKATEEPA